MSTVAILGYVALYHTSTEIADIVMQLVIETGVNHIDVAPEYGKAEELIGSWMDKERDRFFLGSKTRLRTKGEAATELRISLENLRTDKFDLYQLHAVTSLEELDQVTRSGGALEAIIDAREKGLTDFIGITSHGNHAPTVLLEALRRFDFDTVLFPINPIQYAIPNYKRYADELMRLCRQRDVGTLIIKSIAKRPWGDKPRTYDIWYEPFTDPDDMQRCVNFSLSQKVTGLCSAAEVNLIPPFLRACENFTPMSADDQNALIAEGGKFESIF